MVFDMLRSANLAKARLVEGSEVTTWVRWFRAAPEALPFPHWSAFGSSYWEWNKEFEGPGMLDPPLIWRRSQYPAPPGLHYHGQAAHFLHGLPTVPALPPPLAEVCGEPVNDPRGGVVIGGESEIESEEIIVTLIVSKDTLTTLTGSVSEIQSR